MLRLFPLICVIAINGCTDPVHRVETRIVRRDTVQTRTVATSTEVKPGGRPGGRGDCRALLRDKYGWTAQDSADARACAPQR
jgi:hypothetical protein